MDRALEVVMEDRLTEIWGGKSEMKGREATHLNQQTIGGDVDEGVRYTHHIYWRKLGAFEGEMPSISMWRNFSERLEWGCSHDEIS